MNDSLADSLEWLGVHAVDLYLIHSPRICGDDIPSCWEDFLRLKGEKKTRESGVSNFKVEHLEEIRNAGLEMVSPPLTAHQLLMLTKRKLTVARGEPNYSSPAARSGRDQGAAGIPRQTRHRH